MRYGILLGVFLTILFFYAGCDTEKPEEGLTDEEKITLVMSLNEQAKELYADAKEEQGPFRDSIMDKAITKLDSSMQLDSTNLATFTLSTQLLCFRGEFERALAVLEAVERYHPKVVEAIITKGLVLDTLNYTDAAKETYLKALEVSKEKMRGDEETWVMENINQAHIIMLLGDQEGAVIHLDTLQTEEAKLREIIDFHKDRIRKKGRKFLIDLVFGRI